jgi:hypothetical protein
MNFWLELYYRSLMLTCWQQFRSRSQRHRIVVGSLVPRFPPRDNTTLTSALHCVTNCTTSGCLDAARTSDVRDCRIYDLSVWVVVVGGSTSVVDVMKGSGYISRTETVCRSLWPGHQGCTVSMDN